MFWIMKVALALHKEISNDEKRMSSNSFCTMKASIFLSETFRKRANYTVKSFWNFDDSLSIAYEGN